MRTGNSEIVDKAIFNWFLSMGSQNVQLSTAMIQEEALTFAKASDVWLRRWKQRNHITFKTVLGESKSVAPELVDGWWETSLPTVSSNCELKRICNADEFGLFYE